MRTLNQLNIPQDNSPKFPFSTIQNETDTQLGTPVYRELYGDILTNIYKILQITGVVANGNEDSDDTSYQFIDALKKFSNELNDVEQILSLNGTTWEIPLNLSILPNRYVVFSRVSDVFDPNVQYNFKGTGATLIPLTSPTGFAANDEVLIIIDTAGVRVYSISQLNGNTNSSSVDFPLGSPLPFNDSGLVYYFENGVLFNANNNPPVVDVQNRIRANEGNGNLLVLNAVIMQGFVIVLIFDPIAETYSLFTAPVNDLQVFTESAFNGFNPPAGVDNEVYMYADGDALYFTNAFNNSVNDNDIAKFRFEAPGNTFDFVSITPLINGNFTKTTNAVISNGTLFTFIGNRLSSFNLNTAASSDIINNYPLLLGVLFRFSNKSYFLVNGIGTEFNL